MEQKLDLKDIYTFIKNNQKIVNNIITTAFNEVAGHFNSKLYINSFEKYIK